MPFGAIGGSIRMFMLSDRLYYHQTLINSHQHHLAYLQRPFFFPGGKDLVNFLSLCTLVSLLYYNNNICLKDFF
jgi:hypothetical protein